MALQGDAQRILARKELDKLHRGMVVELDRRLVQPTSSSAHLGEEAVSSSVEQPVSEAIDIVQRTVHALALLRESTEHKEKVINDHLIIIRALEDEKQAAFIDRTRLQEDLETERQRVAALSADREDLEAKVKSLESECGTLAHQLERLVNLIKASFDSLQTDADGLTEH
jgi:chromosome segregation ATPase